MQKGRDVKQSNTSSNFEANATFNSRPTFLGSWRRKFNFTLRSPFSIYQGSIMSIEGMTNVVPLGLRKCISNRIRNIYVIRHYFLLVAWYFAIKVGLWNYISRNYTVRHSIGRSATATKQIAWHSWWIHDLTGTHLFLSVLCFHHNWGLTLWRWLFFRLSSRITWGFLYLWNQISAIIAVR